MEIVFFLSIRSVGFQDVYNDRFKMKWTLEIKRGLSLITAMLKVPSKSLWVQVLEENYGASGCPERSVEDNWN